MDGIGAPSHCGTNARRGPLQTLLVDAMCGGVLGLLPSRLYRCPGSPRRGSADPGLYYATPLGLMWRGVEWKNAALPVFWHRILVNFKAEVVKA
jgi:hypothetical protein